MEQQKRRNQFKIKISCQTNTALHFPLKHIFNESMKQSNPYVHLHVNCNFLTHIHVYLDFTCMLVPGTKYLHSFKFKTYGCFSLEMCIFIALEWLCNSQKLGMTIHIWFMHDLLKI